MIRKFTYRLYIIRQLKSTDFSCNFLSVDNFVNINLLAIIANILEMLLIF